MKALITGGAGFIGSHLSDVLLDRGWDVQTLDDLSTGSMVNIAHLAENPKFYYAVDSVLNEMVLDRLVSDCDVIYHLAAAVGVDLIVKNPVRTLAINVEGTNCVLKAARRYDRRVVIASSSEVYGKGTQIPFREDDDTVSGPTSMYRWSYACSKAIDEFAAFAVAKECDLPVHIVRLFNTVGKRQSGQYGMVLPRFVGQALDNEPICVFGDGEQTRCFANVRDVTGAMADLVTCPETEGEVINLGSDAEISINDLASKVKAVLGSESTITHISYNDAYEEGFEDMRRRVPDLTKARKLIGYRPAIGLEQTIQEVAGPNSQPSFETNS